MRGLALGFLALFSSTAAFAADPEVVPAQPSPARLADWTGAYVNISAGYGWLRDHDARFAPPMETYGSDPLYGITLGYLHQMGRYVIGAEGTYQYQRIVFDDLPPMFPTISTEEAFILRGRVGATYDKWLFSANVGAIFASTNIGMEDWGAIAGVSADYLLDNNMFVGAAYDHQFYRNFDEVPLDADIDQVTLRLGYKF